MTRRELLKLLGVLMVPVSSAIGSDPVERELQLVDSVEVALFEEEGIETTYPTYKRAVITFTENEDYVNKETIWFPECGVGGERIIRIVAIMSNGKILRSGRLHTPRRVSHMIRPCFPSGHLTVTHD